MTSHADTEFNWSRFSFTRLNLEVEWGCRVRPRRHAEERGGGAHFRRLPHLEPERTTARRVTACVELDTRGGNMWWMPWQWQTPLV